MKIFIVTKNFPGRDFIGGAEYQSRLLASRLPAFGWETHYVALEALGGEDLSDSRFQTHLLAEKGESLKKSFREFSRLLKDERPDVCYIRDFRYLFPLRLALWRAGVPVVFNTTHEKNLVPYAGWQGWKGTLLHALDFFTLFTVRVVTNNRNHALMLKKRYGIRASVILNSAEDFYESMPKKRQALWVANLKPRKRPELFLELAADFGDTDWEFLMVGYLQADAARYRRLIRETEAKSAKFKYLSGLPLEKALALMNESAIFISTCEPEGFPNNVIQACLAACAVISFAYDPDGVFRDHQMGIVPQTFDELKSSLDRLMRDENRRRDLGEKARTYAKANHDVFLNLPKFDQLFRSVSRNADAPNGADYAAGKK